MDPAIDFAAFFKEFDTVLMGRRTFEMARQGAGSALPGMQTVVCSRTLRASEPSAGISALYSDGSSGTNKLERQSQMNAQTREPTRRPAANSPDSVLISINFE